MIFEKRESAAFLLLSRLQKYKDTNPLVLGIPRGAIPMAKIISDGLGGELSAVLVHKIPAPGNREFAIGCVGLSGHIYRSPYVYETGIPENYIQAEAQKERLDLEQRFQQYGLTRVDMKDRVVIIVDDGIATGATTKCAIHEVRAQSPQKIVLATAVSAKDSAVELEALVDEFVVLSVPFGFFSVGQFFNHFPQVTDEEVIEALHPSENFLRE